MRGLEGGTSWKRWVRALPVKAEPRKGSLLSVLGAIICQKGDPLFGKTPCRAREDLGRACLLLAKPFGHLWIIGGVGVVLCQLRHKLATNKRT